LIGAQPCRLGSPQAEQWAALGAHRGEAVDAGASEQGEEHGLGLVVSGVSGQDTGRQGGVTGLAGAGFQIRPGSNGDCYRVELGSEPVGGGRHDGRLVTRVVPQAVIDVPRGHVTAGGHGEDEQG
jgi:hypothetical protein